MLGFQFPVDGFYMHSFEVWLATTVVFFGSGNVGFTLLEYRLGEKSLVSRSCVWKNEYVLIRHPQLGSFFENIMWIPFL